ncbi:DUF4411 family protein [Corynebacterium sputi]|uniref:DUF4411 family protein n=1 Tax=Corynebacterium sputi TaxID=489915 RepID=UPI00041E251B|nr:DUF4411 family protein [Corynebacterium sputi]
MYLLDANILIDAKNRYYAFDLAPGFWEWIDKAHQSRSIASIDAVQKELIAGNDDLADWAKSKTGFFLPVDQASVQLFPTLTQWASNGDYRQDAINEFTGQNADYQLIAYAKAHRHVVVTNERSQPLSKRRIMIPDACQAMGVATEDPFTMLRKSGARFVL